MTVEADRGSWPPAASWEPPTRVRSPFGTTGLVVDQRGAPVRDQLVSCAMDQEQWWCFRKIIVAGREALRGASHHNGRLHRRVIQHVLATRPSVVTAPLEWPAAPISSGSTNPERTPLGTTRVGQDGTDHEGHVFRLVHYVTGVWTSGNVAVGQRKEWRRHDEAFRCPRGKDVDVALRRTA